MIVDFAVTYRVGFFMDFTILQQQELETVLMWTLRITQKMFLQETNATRCCMGHQSVRRLLCFQQQTSLV